MTNQQLVIESVHEPQGETVPNRVIVVPVDKSEHCSETLDWTLEKLATKDDQIVLLHVRGSAFPSFVLGGRYEHIMDAHSEEHRRALERKLKEDAHELMTNYAKRVIAKGIPCRAIVLVGDPREQLELKIQKLNPDFVVMASRTSNTVKAMFLGSVAKHLLHQSNVPVLIRNIRHPQ
jgi:nucleotide-binding universal stress UspA family protein